MVVDLCGCVLGGFVVDEFLDEGGYGRVYRARQRQPEREVVIKVLRHKAPAARFNREAQSLARVSHPNAVKVIASGIEDDGLMWIAMELVRGKDLGTWLAVHGPMPLAEVAPLIEQIADAVHTAHKLGIVHRDLKPNNIMVTVHGGKLVPTLLDFGIAKWLDDVAPDGSDVENEASSAELFENEHDERPITRRGVVSTSKPTRRRAATPNATTAPTQPPRYSIGTHEYKAPEMWVDPRNAGPAADVYALGIIAYELLAGRRPFHGETKDEWSAIHRLQPLRPIGGSTPDVFEALHRALAKRPEDRPSARAFAASLRHALAADPAEQIKASARLWQAHGRSPDLLWGPSAIAAAERRQRIAHDDLVTGAFLAASRRRVQVGRWRLVAAVLAIALAAGAYRWRKNTEVVDARLAQGELEQGRAALLHGEMSDAREHLTNAWRSGDHAPAIEFMLARALQPLRAELARLHATSGRMWAAAFSPDGRQIVTADDQAAQIWDGLTYRLLHTLAHGATVYDARYSADGELVITVCGDGAVRIWDAASGMLERELRIRGRAPQFAFAAVSPDRLHVAAVDFAGSMAAVWETTTGAVAMELELDASEWPSVAFSSDGRWLAIGSGQSARVIDTITWRAVLEVPGQVRRVAWHPEAPQIITGSATGDVSLWSVPDGARLRHFREIGAPVDAVAVSRDGRLLAAASQDGTEQIFDTLTGRLTSQINRPRGRIPSIEFDTQSKLVVAAEGTGEATVSDSESGMPIARLVGPTQPLRVAHFDRSSKRVIVASWDGTARVWDASSPYRRWHAPQIADSCGLFGGVEPDGWLVAIGCVGAPTRIWDTIHDRVVAELPPVASPTGALGAVFPAVSPAGDKAAIARNNTVELYEIPSARLLRTVRHSAAVTAVAFGHADSLVSGGADGSLFVTRDGASPVALEPATSGIDAVVFDGDRIIATDAESHVRIVDRGAVIALLKAPARVRMLRLSPNGTRLLTIPSYRGETAPPVLWDLARQTVVARLDGSQAYSARWIDNGRNILTTHIDGAARLWDADGRLLRVFRGGPRFLVDADIDGSLVVAGDGDGLLRFWDRDTGRQLWSMPAHRLHVTGLQVKGGDIVTRGFGGEVSRWHLPAAKDVIEEQDPIIGKPKY